MSITKQVKKPTLESIGRKINNDEIKQLLFSAQDNKQCSIHMVNKLIREQKMEFSAEHLVMMVNVRDSKMLTFANNQLNELANKK